MIIIKRSDANAVRAHDLLQALNTSDNLFAGIEKLNNRMVEMTDAEVETVYGIETGFGGALKTTIENMYALLSVGAFDLFRSQLG